MYDICQYGSRSPPIHSIYRTSLAAIDYPILSSSLSSYRPQTEANFGHREYYQKCNNNDNNNNNNNGNFINLSKIYIVHYKDKPRLVR